MTAPDGDAMAGIVVDFLATVTIDGFIADDSNPAVGTNSLDNETGDDSSKSSRGPFAV